MKISKKLFIGIDEAGRGPVIGPMVLALVVINAENLDQLKTIGVRDSKELDKEKRNKLESIIERLSRLIIYEIIPPSIIDSYNLNTLEYETIIHMLTRAKELLGADPEAVIIDAIGPPSKLKNYLFSKLAWLRSTRLVIEPKADSRYTVVGAASIIAKVIRDTEIEKLRKLYGVKGSGYPTDPATREWIIQSYKRNPTNPPWFIRRTWSTLKQIAPLWYIEKKPTTSNKGQRTLLDYLKKNK